MRALALCLAALVAAPAFAHAQTRGVSHNPSSATPPRGDARSPRGDSRYGDSRYGAERRGAEYGSRRRERPVVILVAPYDGYAPSAYAPSGYVTNGFLGNGYTGVGSASTVRYTGSYAPPAPSGVPDESDTTYVRYVPSPAATLDVGGTAPATMALAAERVGGSMLRLRWTGRDPGVREVTLVVADANRRVLAAQTVRSAPWSADFETGPRVAFVGTTIERTDGVSTTTLVPVSRVRGATVRKPLPPIHRSPD